MASEDTGTLPSLNDQEQKLLVSVIRLSAQAEPDWNVVAQKAEIVNGQAARKRFIRFTAKLGTTDKLPALSGDEQKLMVAVLPCYEAAKPDWKVVAEKTGVVNGQAVRKRFIRLLRKIGVESAPTPKKTPAKRAATPRKSAKKRDAEEAQDENDEDDADPDIEPTPSKKAKTVKQETEDELATYKHEGDDDD